ncbi:S1C family serine protease [Saccharopolyspora mangrovi]|uniref:Trypsin-like peptidase domain-containing protein n=1 Tax=Saccharopolyspora mangrovi TaxID=3082379 RepID=A0ABU6A3L6_9PSEU|nr:trypsin-like peptidase domain-containing protein [Saccharopolyspora sp. S2-29]MEB3366173.1 trypsin-like peptidase domain-containing protein [Saccharopolyspora sp. S2-29]
MTEHTPEEPKPSGEGLGAGDTPQSGVPSQQPSAQPGPSSQPTQPTDPGAQGAYAQQPYGMYQQPQQTQQFAQQPWAGYPSGQAPQQKKTGRGLATGVAVLALVCGLVGGGVGGFVGYQLGGDSSSGVSALDESKPARSASTAPQGSVQQVAQKVLPSVVQIQIASAQGSGEGSGIVLSSDGLILTNNHVAEGGQAGRLTALFHDNRTAPLRVVGTDPKSDLAVVKADITGLTPAELGRSDDLAVGSQVVAIGSPFGLSGTVTSGIVSAKDRPVRAGGESGSQDTVLNALQTDAAINPGNSGGPLVDMDGRVVGINSAIYSPGSGQEQAGSVGLGFAIPIDQARRIATELKESGSATQTTLGVMITNAGQPGAMVREVTPNGPAQQGGLKPGDVITKMDDRAILDPDALVAAVRSHNPGDRVKITIGGPGGERTVDVTLTGQKG